MTGKHVLRVTISPPISLTQECLNSNANNFDSLKFATMLLVPKKQS